MGRFVLHASASLVMCCCSLTLLLCIYHNHHSSTQPKTGNFLFEQAMLEATTCDIYTFDCTFEGSSIHPRHTYYKWCIGNPGLGILSGLTFKTWDDVTLTELHHDYVNLLKIDIEGTLCSWLFWRVMT